MMMTNVSLSRTLAGRGSLFCKSGPIYVVSIILARYYRYYYYCCYYYYYQFFLCLSKHVSTIPVHLIMFQCICLIYSKIFRTSLTFLTFPSSNLIHKMTKSCSIYKGVYVRPQQDNFVYQIFSYSVFGKLKLRWANQGSVSSCSFKQLKILLC